MKTQNEISLLADQELEVVVGGRIATGMDPKPRQGGVAGNGHNQFLEGFAIAGTAGVTIAIMLFV